MNKNFNDDFDLYNVSMGVTPEEVERATRNEVLIIRGRRRKVRVPTDQKNTLLEGAKSSDGTNPSHHPKTMKDNKVQKCNQSTYYNPETVQNQTDSRHQQNSNLNEETFCPVISERDNRRVNYKQCGSVWDQDPDFDLQPFVCENQAEKSEFFNPAPYISRNQPSPQSVLFHSNSDSVPTYQQEVWNFEAVGDVPSLSNALKDVKPKSKTNLIEISAQTSATLLDATIQDDKFGVIKSMEAYQKGLITLGYGKSKTHTNILTDKTKTKVRQTNDHRKSPQEPTEGGGSNRHKSDGHNQRQRHNGSKKESEGQSGGNAPDGGGTGGGGGGGGWRKKHSSSDWDETTDEEKTTTTTQSSMSQKQPSKASNFNVALHDKRKKLQRFLQESTTTTIYHKMPSVSLPSSESVLGNHIQPPPDLFSKDPYEFFPPPSLFYLNPKRNEAPSDTSALLTTPSVSETSLHDSYSALSLHTERVLSSGESKSTLTREPPQSILRPSTTSSTYSYQTESSVNPLGISAESKSIRRHKHRSKHHFRRQKDAAVSSKLPLSHGMTRRYLHKVVDANSFSLGQTTSFSVPTRAKMSDFSKHSHSAKSHKSSHKSHITSAPHKHKKRSHRKSDETKNFSDSEISSDKQDDSNEDPPSEKDERDMEWLDESDEGQPDIYKDGDKFPLEGNPEEVAQKFMTKLSHLFNLMKVTGRMPLTMVKTEKCVTFQFDRGSKEFLLFCATSVFLVFCCTLSIISLLVVISAGQPRSFYEDILTSEYDKYRFELFLSLFTLYFTCVWSLWTIFEGGLHLAQYLTRWNIAILTLRYDVTPNIRWHLNSFIIFYTLYAFIYTNLFIFGGETFPSVKGASGFIALTVLEPIIKELRLSPIFYTAQYFGLALHLYLVWSGGLLLILILSYCLALQNAAKKLNLRIAFALQKVAVLIDKKMRVQRFRVIPYWKLWGEHVILTSLSRHTGAVFNVALNAFYLSKMAAMMMTLYALFEPIIFTFPQFNETFFNLSQTRINGTNETFTGDIVPIRFAEPEVAVVGKAFYFFVECWMIFFIVTQFIRGAGSTLMAGYGYIRRHGSVLCNSTTERRYIGSMQNSYAPNQTYFIRIGYEINRQFILGFVAFVIVIFLILAQFSPSRLKTESTIVCDDAGRCQEIIYNKRWAVQQKQIIETKRTTTTTTTPRPTITPLTGAPKPGRTSHPPCLPEGRLPVHLEDFTTGCRFRGLLITYLPIIFTITSDGNYYDRVSPACSTHLFHSKVLMNQTLYNCFGEAVSPILYDECRIPRVSTPNIKGNKTNPTVDLVTFPKNAKPEKMFCCFKFSQLEDQATRCNLRDPRAYSSNICARRTSGTREIYEELLQREITVLEINSSPERDSRLDWSKWSECICQAITEVQKDENYCNVLINDCSPCNPLFLKTNWINTFDSSTCPIGSFAKLERALKMQILYKKDKYHRYQPIGLGTSQCGSHFYPTSMDLQQFRNGIEFKVTDCLGNELNAQTLTEIPVDDCQNLKLPSQGSTEIQMVYNKMEIGSDTTILCCFSSSQITPQPFTICNLKPDTVRSRCQKTAKSADRQMHEDDFWRSLRIKPTLSEDKDKIGKWKDCICQGVGGINSPVCNVEIENVPPCDPTFNPSLNDFTGCSLTDWDAMPQQVKMQLLYSRDKKNKYSVILGDSTSCSDNSYALPGGNFLDLTSYKQTLSVTNCFGQIYSPNFVKDFDDCDNLYIDFMNEGGYSGLPEVKLVKRSSDVICCYAWKDDGTTLTCNLPVGTSRFSHDNRCRSRNSRHFNATSYVVEYLRWPSPDEKKFRDCICQQYINGNFNQWDDSICIGLIPTTTTPTTTTTTPTTTTTTPTTTTPTTTTTTPTTTTTTTPTTTTTTPTTTTTTTARTPTTTRRSANRSYRCMERTSLREFETIMTMRCPFGGVDSNKLIFGYTDDNGLDLYFLQDCSSTVYDKLESFRKPTTGQSVWDCYGNEFKINEWRDDCGNFPLHSPNNANQPTSPKLVPIRLSSRVGEQEYRCCWEYEGFPFRSTDRSCNLRSTNSGNAFTMKKLCATRNGTEMCGTVFSASNSKNAFYNERCLNSQEIDPGTTDPVCIQNPDYPSA